MRDIDRFTQGSARYYGDHITIAPETIWGGGEVCPVLIDREGRVIPHQEVAAILAAVMRYYLLSSDEDIDMLNSLFRFMDEESEKKAREVRTEQRRSAMKTAAIHRRKGYVYVLKAGPFYKIGVSKDVAKRVKQLSTLPPFDLEIIHTIWTEDSYGLEAELHEYFNSKRKNGEWFTLDEADIEYIEIIANRGDL